MTTGRGRMIGTMLLTAIAVAACGGSPGVSSAPTAALAASPSRVLATSSPGLPSQTAGPTSYADTGGLPACDVLLSASDASSITGIQFDQAGTGTPAQLAALTTAAGSAGIQVSASTGCGYANAGLDHVLVIVIQLSSASAAHAAFQFVVAQDSGGSGPKQTVLTGVGDEATWDSAQGVIARKGSSILILNLAVALDLEGDHGAVLRTLSTTILNRLP